MSYQDILRKVVNSDDRFVVVTAENRAAIRDLPEQIGDRFIDVGICEQTMIGAAAGLALRGRIPVVHALASFLTLRAFEFVRTDVGIPGLPVKLVGSFAGFLSEANGATHQAIEDISLMRGVPNINVWCPADAADMLLGLETILRDPVPYYIRYNSMRPVVEHSGDFRPGQAEVFAEGSDCTMLTHGVSFGQCYRAAETLRDRGFSVGLVNMRTLKPVDADVITDAACRSRLIVAVEDHFRIGGLYSIIAETFLERQLSAPLISIALDGRWFKPGLLADILEHEGFTHEAISNRLMERLSQV